MDYVMIFTFPTFVDVFLCGDSNSLKIKVSHSPLLLNGDERMNSNSFIEWK